MSAQAPPPASAGSPAPVSASPGASAPASTSPSAPPTPDPVAAEAAPDGRGPRTGWIWRRLRIVVPSLAAGVGLTLSLPPFGFWILAIPAAALLWWRLGSLRWYQRLGAGWVAGLGLFIPGLWWATSFNMFGAGAMMVVESLAPALACLAASRRGRILVLTGAMTLIEALRSVWPFGGLPLGGVALGQAGGPLAGAARLGGPLLLVALVWLGGCGLGVLATWAAACARRASHGADRAGADGPATHQPRTPNAGTGALAAALVALAAVAGLAWWGSAAPDGGPARHTLRVASVQGGGIRGLRKAQVDPAIVYEAQVAATAQIPTVDRGRPPGLILWPEDVVALNDPIESDPVRAQLASIAIHAHATFVVGVTETVSSTRYRNEMVAFSPSGAIVDRYEKVHRVPFGEYVPDRGFFAHLANLSAVPLDAIPGHGDGLMRTPAGPLGTMISYEVFFPERGWLPTRAGAQLLIVPTNTSSYATSQVPCQEVAAARLQAIAGGRDLVQAAPTGFSSFVDHRGHVVSRSALGVRSVLVGDVAMRTGRTLYGRLGDLPVLAAAGACVLAGWGLALATGDDSPLVRRRRRRGRYS